MNKNINSNSCGIPFSKDIGILGATSFVGRTLLRLLVNDQYQLHAFSRQPAPLFNSSIKWHSLNLQQDAHIATTNGKIPFWICISPVWVMPEYLPWMKKHGIKRIVALSSTSLFTKSNSSAVSERDLVKKISTSEHQLVQWAEANNIEWIILRPTLIYGLGLDKNISEIARFIQRFRFFPLFGKAQGLRQPVHVEDVAHACIAAITGKITNKAYNLSGGESVTYREMVTRIFCALGYRPRFLAIPISLFRLAIALLRILPRFKNWTPAMAERMNRDMIFEHSEAGADLGFAPRKFNLTPADLPVKLKHCE